jgi:uncharacterized protein (TIGR03435 family)
MRFLVYAGSIALVSGAMLGDTPRFEIADVHSGVRTATGVSRDTPPRNGRYEITNASMLDLIQRAHGFNSETILGGPNWLELDRFDVIAKMPAGAEPGAEKAMLQSLLEERFKLVVRKDTKPLPAWVLTTGRQPHMKEADGSGDTGCKPQGSSGAPGEGGGRLMTSNPDGSTTVINLGPGGIIQFTCRNMTMAAFAAGLRSMLGNQLGTQPVVDETGLKGAWNFDVRWSLGMALLQQGDQISVADAIDKQLGLKLEQRPTPQPVLVVESVNRTPTPNSPGTAEALPPSPVAKEFEVADVKLSAPAQGGGLPAGGGLPPNLPRLQMQPGGRFVCQNIPLRTLLTIAFNSRTNNDQLAGLPSWADSVRVDITAKLAEGAAAPALAIDPQKIGPPLISLLAERFGLKYHSEARPVNAYSLIAAKPKMKKADPESRIFCKRGQPPPGSGPGQVLTCQNATMALFAEQLLQMNQSLNWPVLDATGIEGGWDFSFTFNALQQAILNASRRAEADPGGGAVPVASDPGGGYTFFEAIEKQLGLKLKQEKRSEEVIVIDHLEQKPTDN